MDPSPLNSQLKGLFIVAVALLLAVFLGYLIGTEDFRPLLFGTLAVGAVALWFLSGQFFWVLTMASSFLGGTFPVLGGQFTPFHILMAMGLLKFVVEDVILRRVRLKMPGRFDLLMIVGLMSVLLYHGVKDRFGMRYLGSEVWGGRYYVSVFLGLIAFFVVQSVPMRNGLWSKFPLLVLAVYIFDLAIAVVTAVAPSTIYVIFPFYSAVSNIGMQEIVGGNDVTDRIGAFGNFGIILIIFVFSMTSVRRLFHPENFFRWIALGVASLSILFSGYRSAVVNAIMAVGAACVRDLRTAALLVLPVMAAGFFALSVINSEVVRLPKQVQRGLAFLPGKWDSEMARDARSSNDFRATTWSMWWTDYFPLHPLIGRGFGFKSDWTKKSIWLGDSTDYRQMIETGNIHNGLFASLDCLGLVGTLFFVGWNIVILKRALQVTFDRRGGEHFTLRFIALYLATSIVFYWGGATAIGTFLPGEFVLVSVFLRLRKELSPPPVSRKRQPVVPAPHTFRRELTRA